MATATKTRGVGKLRWRACRIDPRYDWRESWVSRCQHYRITLSRVPGLPAYWEAAEWRSDLRCWWVLSRHYVKRSGTRTARRLAIEACEAHARLELQAAK